MQSLILSVINKALLFFVLFQIQGGTFKGRGYCFNTGCQNIWEQHYITDRKYSINRQEIVVGKVHIVEEQLGAVERQQEYSRMIPSRVTVQGLNPCCIWLCRGYSRGSVRMQEQLKIPCSTGRATLPPTVLFLVTITEEI